MVPAADLPTFCHGDALPPERVRANPPTSGLRLAPGPPTTNRNYKEEEMVTFISWRCQCGAHGNAEASRASAKYKLHRGKMTKSGLRPRPGHGLVEYVFFDQMQTGETIHEAADA